MSIMILPRRLSVPHSVGHTDVGRVRAGDPAHTCEGSGMTEAVASLRRVKVTVRTETIPGERRVALLPDVVTQLTKAGLEVTVQAGAGAASLATDAAYAEAGAEIVATPD